MMDEEERTQVMIAFQDAAAVLLEEGGFTVTELEQMIASIS